MEEAAQIIRITKTWLEKVVVGCGFCPFAAREVQRSSVRYVVEESKDRASCLLLLGNECRRLDTDTSVETTLLILPFAASSFRAYLDLLSLAERLVKKQGYDGIYQLASFHPEYRFAGVPANDASNYTNRSPYPIIQILREESITRALSYYPHPPETIPHNNIEFARNKGLAFMKELLQSVYRDSSLS